jgi:hypothetical protein
MAHRLEIGDAEAGAHLLGRLGIFLQRLEAGEHRFGGLHPGGIQTAGRLIGEIRSGLARRLHSRRRDLVEPVPDRALERLRAHRRAKGGPRPARR